MENRRTIRFPTPFHPVLGRRWVASVLAGSVILTLVLVASGVLPWHCPILRASGHPCFGCGTVRALRALARFDVGESLALNPFATVYLLALVVVSVPVVTGTETGERWMGWLQKKDQAWGATIVLLLAQMAWGLYRVVTG